MGLDLGCETLSKNPQSGRYEVVKVQNTLPIVRPDRLPATARADCRVAYSVRVVNRRIKEAAEIDTRLTARFRVLFLLLIIVQAHTASAQDHSSSTLSAMKLPILVRVLVRAARWRLTQ